MKKTTITEARKLATVSAKTRLENQFLAAFKLVKPNGVPLPEREHKFHESRKWRFDFAWPAIKLAVEIQGGSFVRGGHNRGPQQAKDYEKLNEAQLAGWRVLQFNTLQMRDAGECALFTVSVMCAIGEGSL